MNTATPSDALEVMRRFRQEGLSPILIGGLAIEVAGFGGTKDVDVMLPPAQYALAEYWDDEGVQVVTNTGTFTNGSLRLPNGRVIQWDVINPDRFGGDAFFEFVRDEGSREWDVGRVALPAVVYYTRLLVPGEHGRAYLLRILRDLDEGAPESWVREALAIAERFGTEPIVRPKVEEILQRRES